MARTSTEFFLNFNQLLANKAPRTLPKDYCLPSHVKREGKVWVLLAFLVPGSQLSERLFGGKQDWGTGRMPNPLIADPQLEGGRKGKPVSLCLLQPTWRGPQQWKGVHACPTVAVDSSLTLTRKAEGPRLSTHAAHDPAIFLVEQTREVTPE